MRLDSIPRRSNRIDAILILGDDDRMETTTFHLQIVMSGKVGGTQREQFGCDIRSSRPADVPNEFRRLGSENLTFSIIAILHDDQPKSAVRGDSCTVTNHK